MPRCSSRFAQLTALSVGAMLWLASGSSAQTRMQVGPDGEPLPPERRSGFQLFGSDDYGIYRMNMPGIWCWENQHGETAWICPLANPPGQAGFTFLGFRNTSFNYGVPPSEWRKATMVIPELANATGGGYSVFSGYAEEFLTNVLPWDDQLGPFSAGERAAADGSCQDIGPIEAGNPLLPSNTCPVTWGSVGWVGGQIIPVESYQEAFDTEGPNFSFDFWRMPEAYAEGALDPSRTLGFHHVYGYMSDWSEEKRAQYGAVLPGGQGDPARQGWPLGLLMREDAFSVPIPSLQNVLFVQVLVINRSEDVYGVPLDYDSLYFGLSSSMWWNSNVQNASFYYEPWTGMVKSVSVGAVQSPPCNNANAVSDILCFDDRGDPPGFSGDMHGGGYAILKSPIGDLRNKLFTRRPDGTACAAGDPFCDPTHPLAGDTITFNHAHNCGFRACTATTWRAVAGSDWQRRMFGMISSITSDALGSRTATTISDRDYWHIFRSYTFPGRVDDPNNTRRRQQGFNTHVPGEDPETRQGMGAAAIWDYNGDMIADTLFLDSCNPTGCVDTWSDTLRGPAGAGPYVNAYGNVGTVVGVGPFALAAGDTASWVMAYYIGDTQAEVDRFAANAVDHYLSFYLAPSPPQATSIRAVEVTPGDPSSRTVRLFLGNESEDWVDPFLAKQSEDLAADPITIENPWLPDTLAFLAENNLRAVHIFRSCDGGVTFDATGNCAGNPATGGRFADLGWQPYRTFDLDALPEIPSVFEDDEVVAGREIIYVAVAESRGAAPVVVQDGRGTVLTIAPSLFNALSTSVGEPNVARVYIPASLQAGATRATVTVAAQDGPTPIDPEGFHPLSLSTAGDQVTEGQYSVRFGAPVTVIDTIFGDPTEPNRVSSVVRVTHTETGQVNTFTGARVDGVTVSGGTTTEEVVGQALVRTTTFADLTGVLLFGQEPILATTTLTGDPATPGRFVSRADWPRLMLSVANRPGEFNRQFFTTGTGDEVADAARPAIIWGTGAEQPSGAGVFGDIVFSWEAAAFGPNSPFTLNFFAPEQTEDAVTASLEARAAPQTTLAPSPESFALAQAAVGSRVSSQDDLVQARLPFTIRNESLDHDVQAIMLRRPSDTRLLGRGGDTLRIDVQSDVWLPGDTLILVEPVDGEQTVTWNQSVLGCFEVNQFVRLTCNPVRGDTRGGSLFLSPQAGQGHHVQHFNAYTSESRYTFVVRAPVTGDEVPAGDVRAALDRVKVVPNPYIVSSVADIEDQSTILFTNLPPRGRLRIYTLSGQFVQELRWDPAGLANTSIGATTTAQGDLRFNLQTREGNLMSAGLYIFHVVALDGNNRELGEKLGKFVIIR